MNTLFTTVDEYIATFPAEVRGRLQEIRALIRDHAPDAVEGIACQMPAYKLDGKPLVYFAGFTKHVGLYATPSGHAAFAEALSAYKQGKGSVQFPHNQPLPLSLIGQIVDFRVAEERSRTRV